MNGAQDYCFTVSKRKLAPLRSVTEGMWKFVSKDQSLQLVKNAYFIEIY